jgi:hypothetical protein
MQGLPGDSLRGTSIAERSLPAPRTASRWNHINVACIKSTQVWTSRCPQRFRDILSRDRGSHDRDRFFRPRKSLHQYISNRGLRASEEAPEDARHRVATRSRSRFPSLAHPAPKTLRGGGSFGARWRSSHVSEQRITCGFESPDSRASGLALFS